MIDAKNATRPGVAGAAPRQSASKSI